MKPQSPLQSMKARVIELQTALDALKAELRKMERRERVEKALRPKRGKKP